MSQHGQIPDGNFSLFLRCGPIRYGAVLFSFLLFVLLPACSATGTRSDGDAAAYLWANPRLPGLPNAGTGLSRQGQATFACLKLEQAMRGDDLPAVVEAAHTLLENGPASRPLVDACGWLLANRHPDEARHLLEKAVKILPDDMILHLMLAETMMETGETAKAQNLLEAYTASHPNDTAALVELALTHLRTGNHDKALALFARIPEGDRNPSVRYYYAQALRATNQYDKAAAMLRKALAEAPDFLEAMLELALVEEQRGRYAAARKLYEKLLAYDEGNQDLLIRLVALSLKEGNPQRASELAMSVPDSLGFALTASSLFAQEGRYDLASALLDQMAKIPDAPDELTLYRAAIAVESEKNTTKALSLLEDIATDSPAHQKSLKFRIQILYNEKKREEALELCREGRRLYPGDQEIRFAEMEILSHFGRHDEALRAAEDALKEWPHDAELAFQYAFMTDLAGDKAKALLLMEDILTQHPDHAHTLNYIGYTLADENRDLERALQLLTRAVELSPNTDFILDSLAWVQYRLGLYDEAWKNIRHALSLNPDEPGDPTMWDHYGDIALALGLREEARKGWQKALELSAPNPAAIRTKLEKP